MHIKPLGVGGAFSYKFYNNNFLIKLTSKNILIDCGTTFRFALKEHNLNVTDIHYVFITHFHSDHSGGIEEFLQRCYFRLENGMHTPHRPTIVLLESQLETFINHFKTGLEHDGFKIDNYCDLLIVKDNKVEIDGYLINFIITNDLHCKGMNSYGLKITDLKMKFNIIFTSDIKYLEKSNFINYIDKKTMVIFQDAQFIHVENGVHAEIDEIINYYPKDIHNKIYIMHYSDNIEQYEEIIRKYSFNLTRQGELIII